MSTEANKAVVREFFEAGNSGDMERCFSLLAEELCWSNIGTTRFSGSFEGRDTVERELVGPLFGQLKAGIHTTIEQMTAEEDRVVVQAQGRAETKAGVRYDNTYCFVMRVREGKIVEIKEYFDTALLNEVFGA